eukprot:s245_g3.t1
MHMFALDFRAHTQSLLTSIIDVIFKLYTRAGISPRDTRWKMPVCGVPDNLYVGRQYTSVGDLRSMLKEASAAKFDFVVVDFFLQSGATVPKSSAMAPTSQLFRTVLYLCLWRLCLGQSMISLGIRAGSKFAEVFQQSDADGNGVLENDELTNFDTSSQSTIAEYWFMAPFEATLYAEENCAGASKSTTASSEEARCKNCFDVCGKTFEDGSSMATQNSSKPGGFAPKVRSLRVTKGAAYVSSTFCFGSYNFGFNATSGSRVLDTEDGCVNFKESAHLVAVEPTDQLLTPAEYASAMLADIAAKAAHKAFMSAGAMEAAAVTARGPDSDESQQHQAQLAREIFGASYQEAVEDPAIGTQTQPPSGISYGPNGEIIVTGGGSTAPVEYGNVDDESMVEGPFDPQNTGSVLMCTDGMQYHRGFCYDSCPYGYDDAQFNMCFKTNCPDGLKELASGLCKGSGFLGLLETQPKDQGVMPYACRLGDSFGPGAQEDNGNRDFTVIIASDPQLPWCSGDVKSDWDCAIKENWRVVQSIHNVESLTWVVGEEEKVAKPIGVHITGDLTAYSHENQIQEYRKIWETRETEDPNKMHGEGWMVSETTHAVWSVDSFFLDEEVTWAGYGGVSSCAQRAIAYIRSAVGKCHGDDGTKTVVPNFGGYVDHYHKDSAAYAVKYGKIRFVHLHNYPTFRRQELTGPVLVNRRSKTVGFGSTKRHPLGVASTLGFLKDEVEQAEKTGDYLVLMIHDIGNKFSSTYNVDRVKYFMEITEGARILAMFAGHWHPTGGQHPGLKTFDDPRYVDETGKATRKMTNAWGEEVQVVRGYAPDKQKFLVTQWNVAKCFWRFGSVDSNATTDATKPQWHNSNSVRDQRNFTIPNCTVDEDYVPPGDFNIGSLSGAHSWRLWVVGSVVGVIAWAGERLRLLRQTQAATFKRTDTVPSDGKYTLQPSTVSDLALDSKTWSSAVIGNLSDWIQMETPAQQSYGLQALEQELMGKLSWASHLGVYGIVLPPPTSQCELYAAALSRIGLSSICTTQLMVRIPLLRQEDGVEVDGWNSWNQLRLLCDQNPRLQVRERRSEKRAPLKGGRPRGKDSEARKLTASLKDAKSAEEFVKILNAAVDGPIFNYFHASCAYHRLATWKRLGKLGKAADGMKLPKLNARVQEMIGEGQLNEQALANVLWSFAYLIHEFPNMLNMLPMVVEQIKLQAKGLNAQGLSNILWATANLKDDAFEVLYLVPAIVPRILVKAKDMKPQELSNTFWASAKLKDDASDVLDVVPAIVAQIPYETKDMIGQHLSNILWATAHLKDSTPDVLGVVPAIVEQISVKAKDMKPQELSNILWAAAKLKDDTILVLDMLPAIAAQILVQTKDMIPQHLSNILWASANLKDSAPDVLDVVRAIVARIPVKARDMQPQHLSNILWAIAKLKDDALDVLDAVPAIAAQIPVKAEGLNPQELSNILWASAKLKDDALDVLDAVPAIVAQIQVKAKGLNPQELSNILWASAKMKDDVSEVLDVVPVVVAQIPVRAGGLKPQELSSVLWAAANLKDDAPDVLDVVPAIVERIPDIAKDMSPQDLGNILVALVPLQESVPRVKPILVDGTASNHTFVEVAASRIVKLLPKLSGLDLLLDVPAVVWACARVGLHHDELLSAVANRFGNRKTISSLKDWGLCALYGSYQLLDSTHRFTDFSEMLKKELGRRGLSESDVGWSLEGPLDWAWTDK